MYEFRIACHQQRGKSIPDVGFTWTVNGKTWKIVDVDVWNLVYHAEVVK